MLIGSVAVVSFSFDEALFFSDQISMILEPAAKLPDRDASPAAPASDEPPSCLGLGTRRVPDRLGCTLSCR